MYKEAPSTSLDGRLYETVDGVVMGSLDDGLFANFYIGTVEQKVLVDMSLKPSIYCRYVDDIFLQVPDIEHLLRLKDTFERSPVLRFTYEVESGGRLPFLDVLVLVRNGDFTTPVYIMGTNMGMCLNAKSEHPDSNWVSGAP
ncbi:uncharacterized protein [Procambarus clarkii]|uniref:uncharacterized protein n=1 Tax=Procambarus clarkii TaxID=6728 RepID=UPI003742772F